jgi:hypothetical protein
MEFVVIALILLFLPGLAIIYLAGLDKYRYLLSFSLSYTVFVLWLKAMTLAGQDVQSFMYSYFLLILVLCLLALVKF